MTERQVLHLLPKQWLDILGKFAHASLSNSQAKHHGIEIKYVNHDGGGFHFEYRIENPSKANQFN